MKKRARQALSLLLCGVMLLSFTACSTDIAYYRGVLQLKQGNYAEAYDYLKSSTSAKAEELLEKFVFAPVAHAFQDTYNDASVEYTYGEDGYPLKATRTVLHTDGTQTVIVEEYAYTDSVLRQYSRTYHYSDGEWESEMTTYNERGQETYYIVTDNKGQQMTETFYVYDSQGNLLTRDHKYTYGGWEEYNREEYTYDEQGRPLTYKQEETHNTASTTEKTYVYAEDGSYVVHGQVHSEGNLVIQENYDTEGRILRRSYKDKEQNTDELQEYQYDTVGNKVRYTSRIDGRTETTTYRYNEDNLLLEEKSVNEKGDTTKKSTYTYDDEGRMLTEERGFGTPNTIKKAYVYDEQGNLVTVSQSGQGVSQYTITYTYNEDGTLKMSEKVGSTGTATAAYGYDEWGNRVEGLYQSTSSSGNKREVTATASWELLYFPDGVPEEITKQIELMTWQ